MENSHLINFIKRFTNWQELLSAEPYSLKIKKEGNMAIFNYSQFESDFHLPEVQEARGIIIDLDELKVVCWPFRKFGNYQEEYADKIDWKTAKVQEKIDGSIMKLWWDKDHWQVSTNGQIYPSVKEGGPDFAALFWKAAKQQNLELSRLDPDRTYIFELVGRENQVVIEYPETAIWHIGTRSNITGQEYNINVGIQKPKEYPLHSFEDCIKAAKALNSGDSVENEGFVVVDTDWHRVKIKSPKYVAMHHAATGGEPGVKRIVSMILSGEEIEYLAYCPQYEPKFAEYRKKISKVKKYISDECERYSEIWEKCCPDRKSYASIIKDEKTKNWGFRILLRLILGTLVPRYRRFL